MPQETQLIAACGMNCGVCMAYLREKTKCPEYPCKRLGRLDKRYKTKYGMSMIDNLEFIKGKGLTAFVEKENERWRCPKCGGIICVHRGYCVECGADYHR
jgi:hypothetical protein